MIGANGAGKTTLLRLAAKIESPDRGIVRWESGARVGLLPQRPHFDTGQTVLDAVFAGDGPAIRLLRDYETTVQHTVVVTVSDGTHAVDASLTVDVTDVGGPLDVVVDTAANPFDDDDTSIFEADIEWLSAAGITKGCGTRLFCPDNNVTRGQIAAFLVRAVDLPATEVDFFTDDNDSIFEGDINRLAASGVTKGCSTDSYCADDFVTRGQMAAFLNRALGLPATTNDFFTDDDGSLFEGDINRLAASGVTKGCSTDSYCADDFVTRGQMAAFLHRALK